MKSLSLFSPFFFTILVKKQTSRTYFPRFQAVAKNAILYIGLFSCTRDNEVLNFLFHTKDYIF